MPVYSEKFQGYIADNPNIEFERCDGEVFSYDEVSTANMNNTNNVLPITGGQSSYPVAYIDTDKAQEFTFASSLFTMEMFQMANAVKNLEGDVGTLESKRFDVASLKITMPFEVQENSVKVRGLTEGSSESAGEFTVAITKSSKEADGKTEITFNTADVTEGQTIRVAYRRRVVGANRVTVSTNSTTGKGALYAHWPVYSSGTDCSEAAVKGWVHLYIPRVRVTATPGFDSSYKSAATNSVTFAAIDPKRADQKLYELDYEPLAADGSFVIRSEAESVAWN